MKKLNRSRLGQIGQLKIELSAVQKGYICSVPTTQERFDLLLTDNNGNTNRAQIKSCNNKCSTNTLQLHLERKHICQKSYSQKDIDILLVFIPVLDKILAFPPKLFHNVKKIYINLDNPKSKNYWKRYEW